MPRHRKHTPIVSEKQRGLFGAEYARRKEGKAPQMPGITKAELKSHLEEAGGKNLPKKKDTEQQRFEKKRLRQGAKRW